jgi:hypothetical protein
MEKMCGVHTAGVLKCFRMEKTKRGVAVFDAAPF